ncbi:MAG: TorF family putative porin [Sphingosinicella sp.]
MSRLLLPALLFLPAAAFAQDEIAPPSDFDLSGEIGVVSDYRFRGLSRSGEDPAATANLTLSHRIGLYAGVRGATIDGIDPFRARAPGFTGLGDLELDLYTGFNTPLGRGFALDAGATYHLFVDAPRASDYLEPYASLSWTIGPAEVAAGARYAPSQRAIANEDMLYLFGEAGVDLPGRPWRFTATLGHQDWGIFGSYWTWGLGVEHRLRLGGLPPLALGLRYVDTDLPSLARQDHGIVAAASLAF